MPRYYVVLIQDGVAWWTGYWRLTFEEALEASIVVALNNPGKVEIQLDTIHN